MSVLDSSTDPDTGAGETVLVEFGRLTNEQRTAIELHPQRVSAIEASILDDGVVVAFVLRPGETAETFHDDIRGWAIGNGLPVRGLMTHQ